MTMDRIVTIKSNELDKSIKIKNELKEKLLAKGFRVIDELDNNTELIISIGGDGSLLNTIKNLDFSDKLFVGINTGHLGFLSDVSVEDIDRFIELYINKDYIIQNLPIIKTTMINSENEETIYTVNDIVIKCDKSKVIHANLIIDGQLIQKISGDGLIVSSTTGSTAYNYSAGGSIVDPNLNMVQLTPLNPLNTSSYRSVTSSMVFSDKHKFEIEPENKYEKTMLIVGDGIEYKFNKINKITIHKTNQNIKLIRMPNYEFWSRVSEKFL